ncbi:MAG: subunit of tubulin prefoldin [Cirrosporium novae-zelandiae]|nr:MAG: subunit of tubulin prefoldin [Cirrosporium novae-zelandiae]
MTTPTTPSGNNGGGIDITTLTLPQLTQLKKQLDAELEHLTNSFSKLRQAQTKFKDCIGSIRDGLLGPGSGNGGDSKVGGEKDNRKMILVPLTTSLYVPGRLADREKVVVDVGTGFFVEKSTKDAITFYEGKIEELGRNLGDLEKIIQGKSQSMRVVEDVLRQKVTESQAAPGPSAAAAR